MKKRLLFSALATIATSAIAAERDSRQTFEALKALQGRWRSDIGSNPITVAFRLTANGSALVETWTMAPGRESMTIYTLDGEKLVATHYCPQGNAPSLHHTHTDDEAAHHFLFVDGLNVNAPGRSHVHAFSLNVVDTDTLERNETYIPNGAGYEVGTHGVDRYRFVRVDP